VTTLQERLARLPAADKKFASPEKRGIGKFPRNQQLR
jgi:hypothetical protein